MLKLNSNWDHLLIFLTLKTKQNLKQKQKRKSDHLEKGRGVTTEVCLFKKISVRVCAYVCVCVCVYVCVCVFVCVCLNLFSQWFKCWSASIYCLPDFQMTFCFIDEKHHFMKCRVLSPLDETQLDVVVVVSQPFWANVRFKRNSVKTFFLLYFLSFEQLSTQLTNCRR